MKIPPDIIHLGTPLSRCCCVHSLRRPPHGERRTLAADGPFLMVIGRNKNHFPFPLRSLCFLRSSAGSFFISSVDRYLAGRQDVENQRRNCLGAACIIRRFLSVCPQSVSQTFVRCRLVGRGSGSRWARLMNVWVRSTRSRLEGIPPS